MRQLFARQVFREGTVRSKICVRRRNSVIFEVFEVKFSAKKSTEFCERTVAEFSSFWLLFSLLISAFGVLLAPLLFL